MAHSSSPPFDDLAAGNDAAFTDSSIGREMRAIVWRRLDALFQPDMRILELNCGTGEDAGRLALRGVDDAGASITSEALAGGYRLRQCLDEWAEFDYVASIGPWVTRDKYRLVERFKFYAELVYKHPRRWEKPAQALARWRCRRNSYSLPLEKALLRLVYSRPVLS